jgi:two-component system sensor histidine kinase RegB
MATLTVGAARDADVPGALRERSTARALLSASTESCRASIALPWLVKLRWHAVVGQSLAIAIVSAGFGANVPVRALWSCVAVLALSNAVLAAFTARFADLGARTLGLALVADSLQLTVQLALSGGPSNPFVVLYLVEVLVALLALDARWIGAIAITSIAGFSALFVLGRPIAGLSPAVERTGTWVAVALAIAILAYLGGRLAARIREQEAALARHQKLAARAERLASLSTLAAGAAHELGTPLGTIAIAAGELQRLVEEDPDEALDAAQVVREEVDRCREILGRMTGRAGVTLGELPEEISAAAVIAIACHELSAQDRARVRVEGEVERMVRCPVQSLAQVLAGLVANGLQASPDGGCVVVRVHSNRSASTVRFEVSDQGHGIPPKLLSRLGEPFLTTKPPGQGMGLGLFLAQSFAELCAGTLEINSIEDEGTQVHLTLPSPEHGNPA